MSYRYWKESYVQLGDSALHVAARAHNDAVVRYLLFSDAKPARKNAAGVTAYDAAGVCIYLY